MKLTLDFKNKTVVVHGLCSITEVLDKLKKYELDIAEWSIKSNTEYTNFKDDWPVLRSNTACPPQFNNEFFYTMY